MAADDAAKKIWLRRLLFLLTTAPCPDRTLHGGSNIYILRITTGGYTWLGYHKIGIKTPRVLIPSADLPRYCGRSYCAIAVVFGLAIFGVVSQNDDEKYAHKKRRVRAVAWAP